MFAVIDCNNFFVSCERVFKPILEQRAVVVLSNNDGCVVSRSQEAKDIGIKMGLPAFKMREEMGLKVLDISSPIPKIWNKREVVAISSNYKLYGDMSKRVMSILQEIVPSLEIYSIDESFAEFKGVSLEEIEKKGREIIYKIKKYTGIPVCVGVGPTKTLAKMANRYAKKYKGYKGYCVITKDTLYKALSLFPIEDIWGIGRRFSKKLSAAGVDSAQDFINLSGSWVKRNMGIVGIRLQNELKGTPVANLEIERDKKSITTSRSFGEMVENLDSLEGAVSSFASACAHKLREQNSMASTITIYITTNFFRDDLPKYYNSTTIKLSEATDNTLEIVNEAVEGLRKIYKKGFLYKKAGVIIGDIVPSNQVQKSLFSNIDHTKQHSINLLLDNINAKYGRDTIKLAVQGEAKDIWTMKRESLSREYTTNINEIIEIATE